MPRRGSWLKLDVRSDHHGVGRPVVNSRALEMDMGNKPPSRRLLVLLAHGSKDPRWRLPFNELTVALETCLGADSVRVAYMEFGPPTLADVAQEATRNDRLDVLILPFFLAAGGHLSQDIPAQVAAAKMRFPQLRIELAAPIGEHPRVKALFQELACEYARA